MVRIGIPYASHDPSDPAIVICPVCGERIRETRRQDWESFSGAAYARHFEAKHRQAEVAFEAFAETAKVLHLIAAQPAHEGAAQAQAQARAAIAGLREGLQEWPGAPVALAKALRILEGAAERPSAALGLIDSISALLGEARQQHAAQR